MPFRILKKISPTSDTNKSSREDDYKKGLKLKYYKFYNRFVIPISVLRNIFGIVVIMNVWGSALSMSDNVANLYEADAIKDFANNVIGATWLLNVTLISLKIFAYKGLKNRSWIGYYCNMILIILSPFTWALSTWTKNYLEVLGYLSSYIKPNMDDVLVLATMHFFIAFIFWTVPHLYYFNKRKSLFTVNDSASNNLDRNSEPMIEKEEIEEQDEESGDPLEKYKPKEDE